MVFLQNFAGGGLSLGAGELIFYLHSVRKAVVFKNSLDGEYSLHMESESVPNQNWIHARKESRGLDICKVLDGMEDKPKTLLFVIHLGYFLAIHLDLNFRPKLLYLKMDICIFCSAQKLYWVPEGLT